MLSINYQRLGDIIPIEVVNQLYSKCTTNALVPDITCCVKSPYGHKRNENGTEVGISTHYVPRPGTERFFKVGNTNGWVVYPSGRTLPIRIRVINSEALIEPTVENFAGFLIDEKHLSETIDLSVIKNKKVVHCKKNRAVYEKFN